MSARVSFLSAPLDAAALAAKPKTVLPGGAATERDGVQGVFVVTDGQARFVPIRAGDAIGAGVELLEGPPPGARVVKDPPTVLVDGQAVKEKSP